LFKFNYSSGGKIGNNAIFRFKNKRFSTNSGFKQLRRAVICNPASEKSLSLGTDVAGIDKYFRAIWLNRGNLFELSLHQSRRSHLCFDICKLKYASTSLMVSSTSTSLLLSSKSAAMMKFEDEAIVVLFCQILGLPVKPKGSNSFANCSSE